MKREVRHGVHLLPGLLTTGNLFCGFYAMVAIYRGDLTHAAIAVMVALVLDFLDGAVARVANALSDFGRELDSLADVVSFGVAPGLLGYVYGLQSLGRTGWLTAFLFAVCGAFRLARFNIQTHADKRYFVGLPIPAAAGVMASYILFLHESPSLMLFGRELFSPRMITTTVLILMMGVAFLMVSRVRYRSPKEIDFRRRRPVSMLLTLFLIILIMAIEPTLALFASFLGYTLSGLIRQLPFVRRRSGVEAVDELALRPEKRSAQ
ncbi:MAG: CDP-diacylglycerol--serine O-phosphatidyltransferase [Candidatus Methylomirabilales bacterium]